MVVITSCDKVDVMISANVALLGVKKVPKRNFIPELRTRLSGLSFIPELISYLKTIRG